MDNTLMSPAQIWAKYNVDSSKLKAKFLRYDSDENFTNFEAYISSDTDSGEDSVLTYCFGKLPKEGKSATIIYINGFSTNVEEKVFEVFASQGYNVVCFDYLGKSSKKRYTIYPQNLDFANFERCQSHLCSFVNSPKDSCVFVWSRLLRDIITFVKDLLGQQQKIYLLSSAEGGNILWQVAGMDKRVDAVLVASNAGWAECKGIFKYSSSPDEYNFSDDKIKFISACAPQSYAKFVTCPVFYVSGTNSNLTSIDRVENTLALTQNNKQNHTFFCANLTNTLSNRARNAMRIWLDNIYSGNALPKTPSISFAIDDNKLVVKTEFDNFGEVESLELYYSYNEANSELRHWNKVFLSTASPVTEIPVRIDDIRVFAFSSIIYKDGQCYSSLPKMFDLQNTQNQAIDRIVPKRSHIIYERKLGTNPWVVDDSTSEFHAPELKEGAYDIMGITSEAGNLSTYILGDSFLESNEESILQFDCYCEKSRSLVVELCVESDKAKYEFYTATVSIQGGEWQKIALHHTDFKTKERVPLKNWDNVKKLSFVDIDNTLISNLIWI